MQKGKSLEKKKERKKGQTRGAMKYTAPKKGQIYKRPFTVNNKEWLFLLKKIHKNPPRELILVS